MSLNTEFKIVFQPKQPELYNGKRRFAVGAYSIQKYIGEANAETAILKAMNNMEDSICIKFRKHGSITFYNK